MRTQMTLEILKNALQRNCGDILAAAKEAGVSLIFVNQWRADDAEVDAMLTEAERVGVQGLVSAAIQRGVHGYQKGVYYKGVKVDEETVYSDGLLTTLLKAKVPEFQKEAEGGGVNVQVNVANMMPRANTYEEWLAMKDKTLALPKPQGALPDTGREASLEALGRIMCEPGEVIEAEYTEIPSLFQGIDL